MSSERLERTKQILEEALRLAPEKRPLYLESACGNDPDLRSEVESLIASYEEAGSEFLGAAASEVLELTSGSSPANFRPGQSLGPYKIIEEIGRGGMGVVYKAEDLKLDRHVAIKFLPGELIADSKVRERFEREARAASALDHPNICSIYQLGEHEGQPFIVMQLLEGETLRDWIHGAGRKTTVARVRELLDLSQQITAGLEAAHARGILHRDIKPANIFVTNKGQVKILDFGVAKFIATTEPQEQPPATSAMETALPPKDVTLTRTGIFLGTPSYWSPEQIRGDSLDTRTDLFSLGLVLHEMATGKRAFSGTTLDSIRDAVLNSTPEPIRRLNPALPADLERIVGKSVEKEPGRRYQSAVMMRIDLEKLRARLTPRKRNIGIAAAILLISVAGTIWGVRRWLQPAPVPFQKSAMSRFTTNGRVKTAAISPDGRYVAYTVADSDSGPLNLTGGEVRETLWLRSTDGSEVPLIPASDVHYGSVTFTRDSRFLYFVSNIVQNRVAGTAYRIPVTGGTPQQVVQNVARPFGLALSRDGKRITYVSEDKEQEHSYLMIANADGSGASQIAVRTPPAGFEHPAWSPDGKTLAALLYNTEHNVDFEMIVEFSANGGSEKPLTPHRWYSVNSMEWLPDGRGLMITTQERNGGETNINYISHENGEVTRITNDLNTYGDISLTSDARTMATVSGSSAFDVWVGSLSKPDSFRPLTSSGLATMPVWKGSEEIVYQSPITDGDAIWVMNADGSNPRMLEQGIGKNFHLQTTPDGRYIIFVSERSGRIHLWRMGTDGSDLRQLTNDPQDALDIVDCSPDGKWVFYSKNTSARGIWRVSIDGGEPVRLNNVIARAPAVSPDGKMIAYFSQDPSAPGLAIMPIEGGPPLRTLKFSHVGGQKRWTPDGRNILFKRDEKGVVNIWSQPITGGEPKQVTFFTSDTIFNIDFSPDGKRIVLDRGRSFSDVVLIHDLR